MSATTRKEYPSLAEIVRQETDGGRLIVQFYLGVAYGDIEGFRDHHRAAAARRIDKIAPDLVKEYLHKYHNDACRDYFARSLFPMGRIEPMQTESAEPARRGPNAFQRRLRQHVRNETADGRNIVVFLIGVMDGTITGFKPHHRLEAARELAGYITTESVVPAQAGFLPQEPSPTQNRAAGPKAVRPEPVEEPALSLPKGQCSAERPPSTRERNTPVVPAKAGFLPQEPSPTQRGEVERGSSPSPSAPTPSPSTGQGGACPEPSRRGEGDSPAAPTKPEIQRGGAGGSHSPTGNSKPKTRNFPPITIEELARFDFRPYHMDLYKFARDEITGAIYAFDEAGPFIIDGDGDLCRIDPNRIAGYERATSSPSPSTEEGREPALSLSKGEGDPLVVGADPRVRPHRSESVVPAQPATESGESPNPENPDSDNPRPQLRTRIPRKLRRQQGDARARVRRAAARNLPAYLREDAERKHTERSAPVELTIAERRIREKLKQHWHGPDPLAGEPAFQNYVPP